MGTYTGIIVPLQSNSKNTADESFRISEKERFLDLEHLFPGQGEERGYKGRALPLPYMTSIGIPIPSVTSALHAVPATEQKRLPRQIAGHHRAC